MVDWRTEGPVGQPAGWYPWAPSTGQQRWWDGQQWRDRYQDGKPETPRQPGSSQGRNLVVGTILAILIALTIFWVTNRPDSSSTPSSRAAGSETAADPHEGLVKVVYYVEGDSTAVDITVSTPGGGTSQGADKAVPLSGSNGEGLTEWFEPGDFVYISAQRKDDDDGDVSCRISADGETISQNSSSGPFTIASCQGTA